LDLPDTIEAIRFRMEQAGLTASDMQPHWET
jgi:HTH-type transcriptional regulator/antitoxin HigA